MGEMTTYSNQDLLYILSRQFFDGVATCNPCVSCKRTVRGAGYCKHCLIDELLRRGISAGLINKYCQLQNRRLGVIKKLAETRDEILECVK